MKLKVLLFIVFGFSFNLLFAFNTTDTHNIDSLINSLDSLYEIGHKYKNNGDFYQADLYYNKALFILRNNNINEPDTEGYLLHFIGNNYACQRKYTKAIEYYKQATKLYSKKKIHKLFGQVIF